MLNRVPAGMDPQLARVLATMPVVDLSDLAKIRRLNQNTRMPVSNAGPAVAVEDRLVPRADGSEICVRVCRPAANPEALPAILYCHPGLSFGTLDMDHARCVRFAGDVGCVVVSVDYRLAPEHPFPAGLHDCYTVLCWIRARARELAVDASRVAVAGCSTGATLAAALSLLARDRDAPRIAFQMLLCPATDDRLRTDSMAEFSEPGPMEAGRAGAEFLWRYYLGEPDGPISPYAAPARAEDLSGLPPTYLTTAEFDCVRDEGMDYGIRLVKAGVPTELHHYSGCFHAFDLVARTAAVSMRAVEEQVTVLKHAFATLVERNSIEASTPRFLENSHAQ